MKLKGCRNCGLSEDDLFIASLEGIVVIELVSNAAGYIKIRVMFYAC